MIMDKLSVCPAVGVPHVCAPDMLFNLHVINFVSH